jgi:hypothetical protein
MKQPLSGVARPLGRAVPLGTPGATLTARAVAGGHAQRDRVLLGATHGRGLAAAVPPSWWRVGR